MKLFILLQKNLNLKLLVLKNIWKSLDIVDFYIINVQNSNVEFFTFRAT
jgi:hypothetical protein